MYLGVDYYPDYWPEHLIDMMIHSLRRLPLQGMLSVKGTFIISAADWRRTC